MDPKTEISFHKELDARGLNCPLPILRTKKALADMRPGEVLRIVATDPGAVKDFQAFSRQSGNALLASETVRDEFVFLLQKR
jgi:tRNA 2-thiouridine synthesizing protein A